MVAFLQKVKLPKSDNAIEFIDINGSTKGITVIAGMNGTGKTFLLREIKNKLEKWDISKESDNSKNDVSIVLEHAPKTIKEIPTILSLIGTWEHKRTAGNVPLNRNPKNVSNDIPKYEKYFQNFVKRLIEPYAIEKNCSNIDFTLDINKRNECIEEIFGFPRNNNEPLIIKNSNDITVDTLEQVIGGKLFFRIPGATHRETVHCELVLGTRSGNLIPYTHWSDGQKALAFITVLLTEKNPDILLLDEIENHLHPRYITTALKIIRELVPQAIITTHNPHVITSIQVNRVFEIDNVTHDGQNQSLPLKIPQQQPAPSRKIKLLNSDFDKIDKINKHFFSNDKKLLQTAAYYKNEADHSIYLEISKLFAGHTAIPAGSTINPDSQTQQIHSLISCETVRILDYGAGLGRTIKESQKMALPNNIEWYCWEPHLDTREELKLNLIKYDNVSVIDNINDLEEGFFDVCLLTNIIHELPIKAFVDALETISKYLEPTGSIYISEIYPLIERELFAFPYHQEHLQEVLEQSGYIVTALPNTFHTNLNHAYIYTLAMAVNKSLDKEILTEHLNELWDSRCKRYLKDIASIKKNLHNSSKSSFESYSMVWKLAAIASNNAYKMGIWH